MPTTKRARRAAPVCQKCGTTMLEIVYGEPTLETEAESERGEVVLGGCCIRGDGCDPRWRCRACGGEA